MRRLYRGGWSRAEPERYHSWTAFSSYVAARRPLLSPSPSTGQLMSDESSRSTRPSGQRRGNGAPAWWSALDRSDLPDDGRKRAKQRRWYEEDAEEQPLRKVSGMEGMPSRRRAWLINLAVILVAALMIMLGVGARLPDGALVVGLLFGVPLVLVVITTMIASRRAR